MSDFWTKMTETNNFTETENGAVAYSSTLNACLDAFGQLGAMHKSDEEDILDIFYKAFREDPKTAMHILFYMRDIRGGQGIRRPFRIILKYLAAHAPEYVEKNLDWISEFGRYDDYLCLLDTNLAQKVAKYLKEELATDLFFYVTGQDDQISLLAKWLPSINTSSKETRRYAKMLCKYWNMKPSQYRKDLSKLRAVIDVVERKLSSKQWSEINYPAVPSRANLKYTNTFEKHDYDRYLLYLLSDSKKNAGAVYPKDLVRKVMHTDSRNSMDAIVANAMWNNLPNYFGDTEETGLCMVDTSGSMYGDPYEAAVSLGLYCADKCKGPFHGRFITFAEHPELCTFYDGSLYDKVNDIDCINAGNTDIEAAFDLILKTAVLHNVPQKEMPSKLYIISDMQFDEAAVGGWWTEDHGDIEGDEETGYICKKKKVFMDTIKDKYARYGYKLPSIVYWNVRGNSSGGIFQTTYNGVDCAICSGYSPSLFKAICEGAIQKPGEDRPTLDPMQVMYNAVYDDRYAGIWA